MAATTPVQSCNTTHTPPITCYKWHNSVSERQHPQINVHRRYAQVLRPMAIVPKLAASYNGNTSHPRAYIQNVLRLLLLNPD
eukprot:283606-Chlamydomonas_euryale.AAC.1